jgi:hypothetical protein
MNLVCVARIGFLGSLYTTSTLLQQVKNKHPQLENGKNTRENAIGHTHARASTGAKA